MVNEKMGRFIAEQRKAKGMTQLDLANKLHITDKAISKWERGLSSPDIGLLSQLADILGVSVGDLLKGERTDDAEANAVSSVNEVLNYAEKTVQKKYSTIKLVLSLSFTALMLISIIACAIVDVAITNSFTWSLYPISSIIFAWCVLFPLVYGGKNGIVPSMIAITVLIVPYLFVLDMLAATGGVILKAGAAVAAISLIFLWSVCFIMKRCKTRKLLGAGISTILAAPVCVLINYSLSLTLTPEAGAFDVWDVLDIVILVVVGLALISFDMILKKLRK